MESKAYRLKDPKAWKSGPVPQRAMPSPEIEYHMRQTFRGWLRKWWNRPRRPVDMNRTQRSVYVALLQGGGR